MLLKYDRKKFGKYLQEQRIKLNLSQSEVSHKLGYNSPQFLSNIERGTCALPLDLLKILIRLYNLDSKEIIQKILTGQKSFLRKTLILK